MMDATRTQLEAAANRFHYQRGYNDAMEQMQRDHTWDLVLVCVLVVIAFVLGLVCKK